MAPNQPVAPIAKPTLPIEPNVPIVKPTLPNQPEVSPSQPGEADKGNGLNLDLKNRKKTAKGQDGKPYTTDDGYTFSLDSIKRYDEAGIIAGHDDHEHYIPFEDLDDSEIEAFLNLINGDNTVIDRVEKSPFSEEEIAAKLAYISLQNGVKVEELKVSGDDIIVPHGNHFHTAKLSKTPTRLSQADFEDASEYRSTLIEMLMNKIKMDYPGSDVIRTGNTATVIGKDASSHTVDLMAMELAIPYDKIDLSRKRPAVEEPTDTEDKTESEHSFTPLDQRDGKSNAEIVYSPEEIAKAKAEGKYTTSDGYIFDPRDITDDMGDAYVTPHMDHIHWIPKADLSEAELAAAEAYWKAKNDQPTTVETADGEGESEDSLSTPKLFESVTAAKIVPVDKIPYTADQAVDYRNGMLIIPHHDHYHNLDLSRFDGPRAIYEAPEGYSLADLMATIKYYIENPSERPYKSGWGSDSDHGKEVEDDVTDTDDDLLEEEEETSENEGPDMAVIAQQYGMDTRTFQKKLMQLIFKYRVSQENFRFINGTDVEIHLTDGSVITVNVHTMAEVTQPEASSQPEVVPVENEEANALLTTKEESPFLDNDSEQPILESTES
ncbi:pneumococcal-type histidine triad protein [Streptococcus moroccensis]|uniref:pneumococcal-type histidine triad protein n=1 Tax=Streptococcus moroccensis TaxID=1451356 RepID=UPI0035229CF7